MKNTVTPHNSLKKKPKQLDTEENPAKKKLKTIGKTETTWTTYNELKQSRM